VAIPLDRHSSMFVGWPVRTDVEYETSMGV